MNAKHIIIVAVILLLFYFSVEQKIIGNVLHQGYTPDVTGLACDGDYFKYSCNIKNPLKCSWLNHVGYFGIVIWHTPSSKFSSPHVGQHVRTIGCENFDYKVVEPNGTTITPRLARCDIVTILWDPIYNPCKIYQFPEDIYTNYDAEVVISLKDINEEKEYDFRFLNYFTCPTSLAGRKVHYCYVRASTKIGPITTNYCVKHSSIGEELIPSGYRTNQYILNPGETLTLLYGDCVRPIEYREINSFLVKFDLGEMLTTTIPYQPTTTIPTLTGDEKETLSLIAMVALFLVLIFLAFKLK